MIFLCPFKFSMIKSEVDQKIQYLWFDSLQILIITLNLESQNLEMGIVLTAKAELLLWVVTLNLTYTSFKAK